MVGWGHGLDRVVTWRITWARAALSEARKIIRQACHILAELGDDAPLRRSADAGRGSCRLQTELT
jgi:hypothetical protein